MRPLVVVTRNIPAEPLGLLELHFRLDHHDCARPIARRDLLRRVCGAQGLLCMITEAVDAELFDAAPGLCIVATLSVGVDHIDLAEATRRGVLVTHTPGVLTETCADFTWALLLAAARRVPEGDRLMRAERYGGWDPLMLLGEDVHGHTLGIVGFGRIGQAVARRASGFGMRVLYADVQPVFPEIERALNARKVELEDLLRESDFVCLHAALSPVTRHLIDEARLRMMKPSAILVNAARGPIVDERALVRALRGGWIRAAALDVHENEPRLALGLARLPNVVLTPHLASASRRTRRAMGDLAAGGLVDWLARGAVPKNLANPNAAPAARRP